MSEEKDFVTICVSCGKGVTRDELKYVNGRVFHPECYEKDGKNFLVVNQDLLNRSARTKIELVQLKNLKMRTGGTSSSKKSKSRPKKRTARRKTKRRKFKKKRSKTKTRTSRRKVSTRKRVARRTAAKRGKVRRRPARRTKRRTVKRKARRRR